MRIIYQNESGGCSVVIPAPDNTLTMDQLAAKVVPIGVSYKIVPDGEVPSDRTYRNAWVPDLALGKITHNMGKAREIHKDHMRKARTPLMVDLDTAYMRADEKGGAGAAEKLTITAQKQALRDVTLDPRIAAAQTVEELRRVWPAELGRNPLQ